MVAVGEVVAAHALRGVVRVRAYHSPAPSLAAGRSVLLESPGGTRREAPVLSATPFRGGLVLVAFEGTHTRDAAEALVGSRVLVRPSDLPAPGANEFYYHEILGFEVATVEGQPLGSIAETLPTGANDVWVVRGAGHEYLIPVIADVVRLIDRAARRVVIDPLPGLLE
jgi:16S rRNA processing protein RimM